jgi:flavin reductase (DIM6/NTAB) family NADH-FMN oxidoreductase RutF
MSAADPIRTALESMTYGVYVLEVNGDSGGTAMIATWVTQVSFDPQLIAVAVEPDSAIGATLLPGAPFRLHLLRKSGIGEAKHVLKHGALSVGEDREKVPGSGKNEEKPSGALMGSLRCTVEQRLPAGDHVLCIGKIEGAILGKNDERALSLHDTGWKYRKRH